MHLPVSSHQSGGRARHQRLPVKSRSRELAQGRHESFCNWGCIWAARGGGLVGGCGAQPRYCKVLEYEQAAAGGEHDGFGAGGGAEFVEDGVDVKFGGVAADAQARGHVAIGQAFGKQS